MNVVLTQSFKLISF